MTYSQPDRQILYVDDEPKALKYFARMFEDRFSIVTAGSAEEALRYIEEEPSRVSVLVTDQRMPETTGVELMERIRFQHPNIVRVLLTAYSELDAAVKAVNEGGAFRYLTKPFDEDEMIGTLLRAQEHHFALDDRDRLLQEKLSVLHRLIVMDRIRSLAIAATALEGRINNAWPALVAYMNQSPARERIQVQMDEIAGMNMVAIARKEAELMVRTVEMLLSDTVRHSSNELTDVSLRPFVTDLIKELSDQLDEDEIEVAIDGGDGLPALKTDAGLLRRLLEVIIRRLSDLQEEPTRILVQLNTVDNQLTLEAKGAFGELEPGQFASLFAAAIPLQKWPIGLDMDLLSAFMIAHHLGGTLEVHPTPPRGPALSIQLPTSPPKPSDSTLDPAWFDTVYATLIEWQNEEAGLE